MIQAVSQCFTRLTYKAGSIGILITITIVATVLLAPMLIGSSNSQMYTERLEAPSYRHFFGTDHLGRDQLRSIVDGARRSLLVGFAVAIVSGAIGGVLGLASGYLGGWIDLITQRMIDSMMALPLLVLALAIVTVVGPSAIAVTISLAVAFSPLPARVARTGALSIRAEGYVQAARSIGADPLSILIRHVIRNAAGPFVIVVAAQVGTAILSEASLSFLGFAGTGPSLGTLLGGEVQFYMHTAPWLIIFPGLTLGAIVLGVNLMTDGLASAINPSIRRLSS